MYFMCSDNLQNIIAFICMLCIIVYTRTNVMLQALLFNLISQSRLTSHMMIG
jgi:hypothetical protein